jgi:hypothetical protein
MRPPKSFNISAVKSMLGQPSSRKSAITFSCRRWLGHLTELGRSGVSLAVELSLRDMTDMRLDRSISAKSASRHLGQTSEHV